MRFKYTALLFLFFVFCIFFIYWLKTLFIIVLPSSQNTFQLSPTPTEISVLPISVYKVTKIIDGDTIVIEGDKKVRYIGVDTPETKHPIKKVECFGKEASEKNKKLVMDKYVRLEKDVSETDKYGRLLRYVWVMESKDATREGLFVNEYLVKEGYALPATFPPDVKYADVFLKASQEARELKKGLWKKCK